MGTLTQKVIIKIGTEGGGKDGEKEFGEEYDFLNIVLSQQLLKPNVLTFTMEKRELDENSFQEYATTEKIMGEDVDFTILTKYFNEKDELEQEEKSLEFKGIVTNVNVYRRSGPFSNQMIDVQAFSRDFLLMDHSHCYSYEGMNLEKIVTKTIDPYDLKRKQVNPRTKTNIPYIVQYNESNYQFLTRLAIRFGEWMYNDGVQWFFGERKLLNPIELEPRNDIKNFRFSAELKHHMVKHAHHDYLKYKNEMKSDTEIPALKNSYHPLADLAWKKSSELYKKETFQHLQCSNPEGNTMDELNISTSTQLLGEKAQQFYCTGSTVRSDLKIGSVISLNDYFFQTKESNNSQEIANLMITEIAHYTEVGGEYINSFTAYPVKSEYPPYFQSDIFPVSSAQRAKVMDNKDPKKIGRIRVQFLWQEEQDPNLMTPWIRIAQPHGGDYKGFYFIPEIGEEVMVDFENGNAEKPFVVGTLYHCNQKPKPSHVDDDNVIKSIRTRNGHTISFVDEGKGGRMGIFDSDRDTGEFRSYFIGLDSDEKLIKIISRGNIELYASKNIIMNAGGNIESYAGWDIVNKAGNDINSHADNEINSDADSKISISTPDEIEISGDAGVSIKSDASIEIEAGATIFETAKSLDESADFIESTGRVSITLEAPLVEIN